MRFLAYIKHFFIFSFFLGVIPLFAQQKQKSPISFSLNYYFDGRLTKYRSTHLNIFLPNHPRMIEICVNRVPIGNKKWEKYWNYPIIGVSLAFFEHNREELGQTLALNPFFEINAIRRKKFTLTVAPSLGIAWFSKVYHVETNPENTAISAPLNASFFLDMKLKYIINEHFTIHANGTFRHFSNGAVRLPNVGLNDAMWGIGVTYQYTPTKLNPTIDTVKEKKRIRVNLEVGTNHKSINYGENFAYRFYVVSMYASYKVSKINSIVVGMDGYYDESVYPEFLRHNLEVNKDDVNNYSLAANIGTEIFLGNFSYTPQFGWYLYQYHSFYGNFVHRHTMKLYLLDFLYLKGTLKVFSAAADSFDYGLGVRF